MMARATASCTTRGQPIAHRHAMDAWEKTFAWFNGA